MCHQVFPKGSLRELEDYIFTLSIQYDMEVLDVVTLLHSIRMLATAPVGEPPRPQELRMSDIIPRRMLTVPDPSDEIDLREAWRKSRIDEITCQCILAQNPSMDELIDVQLNCYRWLRFWSIRDPDPEWREKLRLAVEATVEAFTAQRAKATEYNTPKAKLVLERLHP